MTNTREIDNHRHPS